MFVFRLGREAPWEKWTCTGLVGGASLERLLEIAAQRLRDEPAVLSGDAEFFDRLSADQRRAGEQWTAYCAGTGPRPQTGKLP